jgi:hypothetical protein
LGSLSGDAQTGTHAASSNHSSISVKPARRRGQVPERTVIVVLVPSAMALRVHNLKLRVC